MLGGKRDNVEKVDQIGRIPLGGATQDGVKHVGGKECPSTWFWGRKTTQSYSWAGEGESVDSRSGGGV